MEAVRERPAHLWQPGQSGNPKGRGPKLIEEAYVRAVVEAFTPEEVMEHLRWCVEQGKRQSSTKVVLASIELIVAYAAGKPVQRVVSTTNGLADIVEALKSMN